MTLDIVSRNELILKTRDMVESSIKKKLDLDIELRLLSQPKNESIKSKCKQQKDE